MTNTTDITLVCGGGGIWGVAWMTGIAMGLADRGVDLRTASLFIGTSAGSVVSTQLASGLDLVQLFTRQTDETKQPDEPAPADGSMDGLMKMMQRPFARREDRRRAMCDFALNSATISPAERRSNIEQRLGLADERWPEKPLGITGVDTETTSLTVFDRSCGVSIIDAVAASCAVPGVWPPTPINGRRYIDGGCWSTSDNLHLASGSKRVLLLSPMGRARGSPTGEDSGMTADVDQLRAEGTDVVVISPDQQSIDALAFGALNPACRKPAAEAGREQGSQEIGALRMFGSR